MVLRYYPALIVQDEGDGPDAGYGVVFPDLPGCTSSGDTVQEAATNAAEALAGHVDVTLDAGEVVPRAAQKLLDLGFEAGLIDRRVEVEFVR